AAGCYDREPCLRPAEQEALATLARRRNPDPRRRGAWPQPVRAALDRLVAPLNDVLRLTHADWRERHAVVHLLLAEFGQRRSAFWAWTRLEWLATLRATPAPLRQYVMAVPYLLLGLTDLHVEFARFKRRIFAWKVFGRAPVDGSVQQVCDELRRWGYG